MFKQIPLSITLRVDSTFNDFYISKSNMVAVDALKYFIQPCTEDKKSSKEHFFYLWGSEGSGVTHALQAIQHQTRYINVQYLPMKTLQSHSAKEILTGLESLDLIIIDDIQKIAGNKQWEKALFILYNRLRDADKKLLIGSHVSSREIRINLPDLHSRLQWGINYQLHVLNDDEKKQALLFRANALGMRLSEEVTKFILNHCSRDLRQLMRLVNLMDKETLSEQRHLTIPFVKKILGSAVKLPINVK